MMTLNIDWRVFAVLLVLIPIVTAGCYQTLPLSTPRDNMGLGKRDGKIYFAGGFYADQTGSTNVDILDPASGIISTIQLPVGRGRISVSSIGSKVLFAGGQFNARLQTYYDKIDVYDIESQTMQTMDFNIGQISRGIKSLVVGSRVFLHSDQSTTVFVLDPIANTMETIELPRVPSAATFGDGRVFFAGRTNTGVIIHILNVGNMTWSEPRTVAWSYEVLGIVYFRGSMALIGYTRLINFDVNNPNRQTYESTFSERNLAAFNLIGEELYIIGPGFITIYLPYARLVRFRSSTLFLNSEQSVEDNGIIYYTGTTGHLFPQRAVQFDTRALLRTVVESDLVIGTGYVRTAFGYIFRFHGRYQRIYYSNLRTNQWNMFNYTRPFTIAEDRVVPAGRKLFVFINAGVEYLLFDADTESWTINAMPELDTLAAIIASDNYIIARDASYAFVLDIAANEWTAFPAPANDPIHIVNDDIVLLQGTTMRIYNTKTRQWRIGLEFDSALTHARVTVQNSTILITGIGGYDYRKLHVYNVETSQYRVEDFNDRMRMTTLVHGDYVIYAGGVSFSDWVDLSSRIDIYNVKTATWKSAKLPPNLSFYTPARIALAARENSIFVARENRVDIVDIESGSNRPLLVPTTEPRAVVVTGSKVIVYSRRSFDRQISVYEATTGETFSFTYNNGGDSEFFVTENFLVASTFSDRVKAMELSTFMNSIHDAQLFIGESVNFNVTVQGRVMSSYWQHNNARLANDTSFSLTLNHVTQESSGTYSINLVDQCGQRMSQQARLEVNGAPVITSPLENSIIMCHELASVSIGAVGKQMEFNWTLESESFVTQNTSVEISGESFTCNSVHQLCVTAYNPSGSVNSCKRLRVIDHDLVFDGPRPTTSAPVWLSGSEVTLTVGLLDEECTEHQWFMNNVPMDASDTGSSSIRVTIDPLITTASFHVVAVCGSSKLESYPYKFTNVSSWTVTAVVLTVIFGALGVAGLGVVAFLVRRRMLASHKHEIELENLLTQAKTETLNLEGEIPIVQSTTWEWSPGDGFTYKPIDKAPFIVDYSSLNLLGKESVKVGVWNQSIIEFSLRDSNKTSSKKSGMRERLIDGTLIDIYVPRSPKYEIKVEPSSVELSPRGATFVTLSTTMRMTAKCKVCLIVVNEREKIYSVIEFKMSSGMSTWIDLEEIESNGEYLGGGGFGSVTLGTYRGQEVAVKKLLSQYLTDEMKIEYDREVTLMKDLRHPNIVQFVGASNVKNSLAIVIEFAPLGSVASVMQKQKLSSAMKITMLLETAKALQFLHTNGIIHRDIKPQNILVFSLEPRAPVHVKLTDFGTARFISDDPTTITKNIGTIAYMAPEALGKSPRIDKNADVYSFAVLIWSMMYEQTPFQEYKWDSDIEAYVKSGQRLPLKDDGSLSAAMIKLIEDCWQHEPSARPSMASVVQRLAAMNQSE